MAIYETFSKRIRRLAQAGQVDVYQYEELPHAFRVQVVHIWRDAIGFYRSPINSEQVHWQLIHDTLARELGLFDLGDSNLTPFGKCQQFLLNSGTSGSSP
jgi:hypothetical protein